MNTKIIGVKEHIHASVTTPAASGGSVPSRDAAITICRQLNLLPRITLLHRAYIDYSLGIREIVNPDNEELSAFNFCAGSSIADFLLATNATRAFFFESENISRHLLLHLIRKQWDIIDLLSPDNESYRARKYVRGHAQYPKKGTLLEDKIVIELRDMQVAHDTVEVADAGNGDTTLRFAWDPFGTGPRYYEITFVCMDLIYRNREVGILHSVESFTNALLEKTAQTAPDIIYWKAASRFAEFYPTTIPVCTSLIQPNGHLVSDDWYLASTGDRFVHNAPDTILSMTGRTFISKTSDMIERSRKPIARIRDADVRAEFGSYEQVPAGYEHYGLPVVRQIVS